MNSFLKYLLCLGVFLFGGFTELHAQFWPGPFSVPPEFSVKTNLLYGITRTINIGGEARFGEKYSLDVSLNYNPWHLKEDKRFRHLLIQPELRYHFRDNTTGPYMGVHAIYTVFNVSKIHIPLTNKYLGDRYEGTGYGMGISGGYIVNLGDRWNLELSAGVGFAKLSYERFMPQKNGRILDVGKYNYLGPTKVGITWVYLIP